MPVTQVDPATLVRSSRDHEHRRDRSAIVLEERLVVEHLPEPEAELAGLVRIGQALDFRDPQLPALLPGEVEVGPAAGRA